MVSSKLQTKTQSFISFLNFITQVKVKWIQLEYSSFCKAFYEKCKTVGMKVLRDV